MIPRSKLVTVLAEANQAVNVPADWSWTLPFSITRSARHFTPVAFDVSSLAPTGKAYYVDGTSGNDGDTGLSLDHAFKTLQTPFGTADYDVIYITPGLYDWDNGYRGLTPSRSFSLIATGPGVILSNHRTVSWALDGVLTHTYKATYAGCQGATAWDASALDANGYYTALTWRANAALVEANPGSWYTDDTTVYVRLADDRAPDANLRVMRNAFHVYMAADITAYFENIRIEGGANVAWMRNGSATGGNAYFKNCTFRYATGSGLAVEGMIQTICQGCTADKNTQDGFNYHVRNTVIPKAIEIDCIGCYNGVAGETDDNGSSMHDGGTVVRLNGNYHHTTGPGVVDIQASLSWNLGCNSHDSDSAAGGNINYSITGTMWLDYCTSSGSTNDLEANGTGSFIFYRGLLTDASNTGAGYAGPMYPEANTRLINQASPVSDALFTAQADGLFELTVTAPNPVSGLGRLFYRRVDDTNRWEAVLSAAGDFSLADRVANVPTTEIFSGAAIGNGQTARLRIIVRGTVHRAWILIGGTWTYLGTCTVSTPTLDAVPTIQPNVSVYTAGQLTAYRF